MHKESLLEDNLDGKAPQIGFPDSGHGRFAEKLEYKQWLEINSVIRSHLNQVEQLPMAMAFFLIGAFYMPLIAVIGAWALVILRILYIILYIWAGPDSRLLVTVPIFIIVYGFGLASIIMCGISTAKIVL